MQTDQAINRLLKLFTPEQQEHIKPMVMTIAELARTEGLRSGRANAATMIEMLVLGKADYSDEDLRKVMSTLRSD